MLAAVCSLKAQAPQVLFTFDNNCADSSGNGNDGTCTTISYTTDIAGLPNKAGLFNGTASYISLPNSWISGNMIGISMWFKTHNHDAPSGLVYAGLESVGNTPTNFTPLLFMDSAGHLCAFFYDGGTEELVSTDTVNDDKWHHVAFFIRVNQVTGEVHQEMWLDGRMDKSRDQGINNGNSSFANIYVGTCNARNMLHSQLPNVWEYFDGTIDDVIFWLGGAGPEYYHHLDLLITEHPQSQGKFVGDVLNLHVSHTYFNPDSTYTYQWKKNGVNIAGAIDSVYSIPSVAMTDAGNYTCTVQTIDSYKVESEPAIITVSPVGVKNIGNADAIKIYPNPAKDLLNIDIAQPSIECNIEVLCMDGRYILTKKANGTNTQLDISKLPRGMYLLRVSAEGASSNTYFIKQ